MKNKLVLQFNETDGFDTLQIKELIKDQITRKVNNIKEKYMKDTKQKNYARLLFLSNQNSPLQVEWDDACCTHQLLLVRGVHESDAEVLHLRLIQIARLIRIQVVKHKKFKVVAWARGGRAVE